MYVQIIYVCICIVYKLSIQIKYKIGFLHVLRNIKTLRIQGPGPYSGQIVPNYTSHCNNFTSKIIIILLLLRLIYLMMQRERERERSLILRLVETTNIISGNINGYSGPGNDDNSPRIKLKKRPCTKYNSTFRFIYTDIHTYILTFRYKFVIFLAVTLEIICFCFRLKFIQQ